MFPGSRRSRGDVRQHNHLQQLDKTVRDDFEHRGMLAEENSDENTGQSPIRILLEELIDAKVIDAFSHR